MVYMEWEGCEVRKRYLLYALLHTHTHTHRRGCRREKVAAAAGRGNAGGPGFGCCDGGYACAHACSCFVHLCMRVLMRVCMSRMLIYLPTVIHSHRRLDLVSAFHPTLGGPL
jgi:hypothetical protein